MTIMKIKIFVALLLFLSPCGFLAGPPQEREHELIRKIEVTLAKLFATNEIPGFSVVVIKGDEEIVKSYGFADLSEKVPVTTKTLFQIGSCSKAFTGLAFLKLANEGAINLDANVSEYLPWFRMYYKHQLAKITLRQLVHHTSGIPSHTLSLIPQSDSADALEETVRRINGTELIYPPGKKYEYATVGYDILALIMQKVTGVSFEVYMNTQMFGTMGLSSTSIGEPKDGLPMAKGYKIGFFRPRLYESPPFRGNNAAGYVISNAEDVALWLKYQMGIKSGEFDQIILRSHLKDESVEPHDLNSYAYGWNVSLRGDQEIHHSGLNPNYTAYILFRKQARLGVAILANSNSANTPIIGRSIMQVISDEDLPESFGSKNSMDTNFSIVSIVLIFFLAFLSAYFALMFYRILIGKRKFRPLSFKTAIGLILKVGTLFPFLVAIYLLPMAIEKFSWESAMVWAPISFSVMIWLAVISLLVSYVAYAVSAIFPDVNKYFGEAPKIILVSILSGLANMLIIVMVTSFIGAEIELAFVLYYFGLAMSIYLIGRKIVDTRIVQITWEIIFDLKMLLANRLFSTSYEKFEKIDRGRVYSTMSGDIETIGVSARTLVNTVMSIITALGAFLYLSVLAYWETLMTIIFVIGLSVVYYFVSRKTSVFFDQSREANTVYMRLLNGMIDGFKEISIHWNKRFRYLSDLETSIRTHKVKAASAQLAFVNAFLTGEFFFIGIIGSVALIIPRIFDEIPSPTTMTFVVILLYLIGPIHSILNVVPEFLRIKIAWRKIHELIRDVPANLNLASRVNFRPPQKNVVESFCAKNISYAYESVAGQSGFSIEAFNMELKKGELLFIIGGNGSGKTTLAKVLTGLYSPVSGHVIIDDKDVDPSDLGEYFSVVFNPFYLFKRLYIDISESNLEQIKNDLRILDLHKKVEIDNNEYSTIELSGGQRKRLALLQCYIEDKPIFLFDEWAADQDPVYRKLFYRELLPRMKEKGKIIIAITHDDNYFDVADKIIKLDMGTATMLKTSKYSEYFASV